MIKQLYLEVNMVIIMTAFYSFMNHIDPFPIEQLYQGSSGSINILKMLDLKIMHMQLWNDVLC